MANIVEKIAARLEAARERRRLSDDMRQMADEIAAETWAKADRDPEDAIVMARQKLRGMSLDPATILLLVRVIILIYQALSAHDIFEPSPETVASICSDERYA